MPHYIVSQDIAPEASWPVEHRVWASIEQCKPRTPRFWDRAATLIIAASGFPLVLWVVSFVAEQRGF
jgi:hypothetical protein